MSDGKTACLTLDLENDWYFDEDGYDHLTLQYLDDFVELIQDLDVPLTVFVVGRTLERFPDAIEQLDAELDVEWHLHSYSHDVSKDYDFREEIRRGVEVFEDHFGEPPLGYRAPQGNIEPEEFAILEDEGFAFDSSVFPSYRPGVYSNLDAPPEPYVPDPAQDLLEVPIGATPWTRIPTAHSYLKLLGRPYLAYLKRAPLPETLVYNVHLQDLYRTESHDNLGTAKRAIYDRNMDRSETLLCDVVEMLRRRDYELGKITDFIGAESDAKNAPSIRAD